jgi:hypothetical protein
VYDSNYAAGESYYKDAIDRLDRKYSGRPTSPAKQSSLPREIRERHADAFADDDLPSARRRAEKCITDSNDFDMPKMRPMSMALDGENGFDDEITNSLLKIQQRRKQLASKMVDDVEMENTFNNLASHRMVARSEKMLDSVGLNESSARKLFDEDSSSIRRRAIKMTTTETSDNKNLSKWSALKEEDDAPSSSAAIRARKSRARLNDLNDEMEAMAEKQASREKRLANLRALMAENAEESEALQMKTARISARVEKKVVTF